VQIRIHFYSYFKELAGSAQIIQPVQPGSRIADLLEILFTRYPKLAAMRRSMRVAVGVEYEKPDYLLKEGDEVSLFPPVQGG
jgi:molybdopterin converting factor small subunit